MSSFQLSPLFAFAHQAPQVRFPFVSPLRSLSRAASDYSSDSAVCFGILRPLRPLREIKDKSDFVFHAKSAKSAEFLFPFLFHACTEGVANFVTTRERREFIHPLPPCGVLAPVSGGERPPSIPLQGEESVTTDLCPHHTYCPPETGGTSAERGGGG